MTSKPDGGHFFAQPSDIKGRGVSLRDVFALAAMHAEVSTAGMAEPAARALAEEAEANGRSIEAQIAHNAYSVADAMLTEREKP